MHFNIFLCDLHKFFYITKNTLKVYEVYGIVSLYSALHNLKVFFKLGIKVYEVYGLYSGLHNLKVFFKLGIN